MDNLKELFSLCNGSVTITYNEHKDLYLSVSDFLSEQESFLADLDIDPDVRKVMIEKKQIVSVRAYPNTPIMFYIVYHWDLESAINEMLTTILNKD